MPSIQVLREIYNLEMMAIFLQGILFHLPLDRKSHHFAQMEHAYEIAVVAQREL